MRKRRICPQCGSERTDDSLRGLCPKCLARYSFLELEGEAEGVAPKEGPGGTVKVEPEKDVALERTGMMIGRYKLLEQIGEGGFGVVYMAEQVEPVQRKVALKVIKAGMDTKEVIARFEAERQALALMDHPNIARVLDAGTTEAGRPYFVMELVKGIPLTEFCDLKKLSPAERLELFIPVCSAVQHAHQKGIIHRDLKPSNVLVTLHDGVPVPKVIDFGVAKALGPKLTEKTLYTGFAHLIGTPAYMSPEQAELSGLDIDTRSDIYSLGVLLYELLTGVTPFDKDTIAQAALDEVRRMIRETEPPKPSTRLRTLGDKLTEVANRRHTEPPRLIHLVRGDLDWIVMKCLEKDRTRRYETANGLSLDIQRHLTDEPILARPPSRLYAFRKTVQRNKAVFATAAALAISLLVGLGVSTWQYAEQLQQRERAEKEAAKATAISDFMQEMLESANPDASRGRGYTVRELLDDFSGSLADQFANQPEVEAALRATIGRAYWRLAPEKALAHHQKALALRMNLFDSNSTVVAESHLDCAWALYNRKQWSDDWSQAESHIRKALAIYRDSGSSAREGLISALWVQQRFLYDLGRFSEGDTALQEALAVAEERPPIECTALASMVHGRAGILHAHGRYSEAEAAARRALSMHSRLRGTNDLETAWAFRDLGHALLGQNKLAEAGQALSSALSIFRREMPTWSDPVYWTYDELSTTLERQNDWRGLEALLLQRLDDHYQSPSKPDIAEGVHEINEALILLDVADAVMKQQGRAPDGEGYALTALRILVQSRESIAQDERLTQKEGEWAGVGTQLGPAFRRTGELLRNGGQHEAARQAYEEALQAVQYASKRLPDNAHLRQELAWDHRLVGRTLSELGHVDDGASHYRQAIDIYATLKALDPTNHFYHQEEAYTVWMLASVLAKAERPEDAATEYNRAIALHEEALSKFPDRMELKVRLGRLLRQQGKFKEAAHLFLQGGQDLDSSTLNGMAWPMATSPNARERDGVIAVKLAEQAAAATSRTNCQILDTLAAAYAEAGQFANAVRVQREAIALIPPAQTNLIGDYQSRLRLFESDWPYREYWREANRLQSEGKWAEAEALLREALVLHRAMFAADHPRVASTLASLTHVLVDEGKFAEAELPARECVRIREEKLPDNWLTFNAQSLLGGSLLGQKKYAEAEPLLLSGYDGMKQREDKIPEVGKPRIKEALERLIQLYEAWGKPQRAAEWKQKMAEFANGGALTKP